MPRGPEACEEAEPSEFDTSLRGDAYPADDHGQQLGLFQAGQQVFLRAEWIAGGVTNAAIPVGHPVVVNLKDGDRLTLAARTVAAPIANAAPLGATTRWSLDITVEPEQVAQLARVGIKALATRVEGIELRMAVNVEARVGVQTLAVCFAGNFESARPE